MGTTHTTRPTDLNSSEDSTPPACCPPIVGWRPNQGPHSQRHERRPARLRRLALAQGKGLVGRRTEEPIIWGGEAGAVLRAFWGKLSGARGAITTSFTSLFLLVVLPKIFLLLFFFSSTSLPKYFLLLFRSTFFFSKGDRFEVIKQL